MIVEITVPELGESISEVEIGEWLIEVGTRVKKEEEIVALESDKATVELPAPQEGVVVEIIKQQGETAAIGEVIGRLDTAAEEASTAEEDGEPPESEDKGDREQTAESAEAEECGGERAEEETKEEVEEEAPKEAAGEEEKKVMPAAARVLGEQGMEADKATASGPGGRVLKEDAQRAVDEEKSKKQQEPAETPSRPQEDKRGKETERRVRMTPIRRTIASRLLEAKQDMALLTTFNEVDMHEVKKARSQFGKEFADKHGVRLGFMSFFIKAAVSALQDFPEVNAEIDGKDIVYHDRYDIGVAIGGGKGLVVPVLRNVDTMGFADIERKIGEFAEKAKNNTLSMDELQGGTFSITNGGVYGSMLSTPIVNPPQSGILGLHAINDRPVVVDGEIVIRPVMYVALTYDHRIIDGREAVTFLKSIKERIEEPQKLLLEI